VRRRVPGATVVRASAESLPLPDGAFDAALAQLVVHFMADPVAGLAGDGARHAPGRRSRRLRLGPFRRRFGGAERVLRALHELDPSRPTEWERPGTRPGHLAELFAAAGFGESEEATLTVPCRA